MILLESYIKFKATFDLTTNKVTIEDKLQSDYDNYDGVSAANVKGLLKVTDPLGQVIHKNAGYDTDDFSSPDLESGGWSLELNMTMDGANVKKGTYTIAYKLSDDGSSLFTTQTKSPDLSHTTPVIDVDITTDIETSRITFTDNTNYGGPVNAVDSERTFTVQWPTETGLSDVTESDNDIQLGPNIYTGEYSYSITTPLTYVKDTWDGYNYFWLVDEASINGTKRVEWDNFTNDIYSAFKTLDGNYQDGTDRGSLRSYSKLKERRDDLAFYWGMYQMALRTEIGDVAWPKQQIINIIDDVVSYTNEVVDGTEIIPIDGVIINQGSGDAVEWHTGADIPTTDIGATDDFYFRTDGTVYEKQAGVWTKLFNYVENTHSYALKTSGYQMTANDYHVTADGSTLSVAITLPDAGAVFSGVRYSVKAQDITNPVTVDTMGGQLIDDDTEWVFTSAGDILEVISNGTNWEMI